MKAKGIKQGTEQIMERQNWRPARHKEPNQLIPVCCALLALSPSIPSSLRAEEVALNVVSTPAQESAGPDSKPDSNFQRQHRLRARLRPHI